MEISKLSNDQLSTIGERIVSWFNESEANSGGRDFGCDWPTMRMIWPAKCRVFDRLKKEYNQRRETAKL